MITALIWLMLILGVVWASGSFLNGLKPSRRPSVIAWAARRFYWYYMAALMAYAGYLMSQVLARGL